jgi:uncharacterized repeat protein (TIGR03803 family)
MIGANQGGTIVNNTLQNISKIRLEAASAALLLAVVLMSAAVATQSAQAQTFTVLHSFTGSLDGAYPTGLVRDAAGNLYGTTSNGGTYGYGTVFKVDTGGREIVLYSFRGGTDGALPADLIQDAYGNLYGTTAEGGGTGCWHGYGCGTVYRVSSKGKESVLYRFTGGTDGASPMGTLFREPDGRLYGTTQIGGDLSCYPPAGCGTVFVVSKAGEEKVLHSFNVSDGFLPWAGVIPDAEGNLLGTTEGGGDPGYGNVFKLNKAGKETVLYHFDKPQQGQFPQSGLTLGKAGTLYGTTVQGGAYGNGTVFKVSKRGVGTVLYSFSWPDGVNPFAGVILDSKGNLCGDTEMGGLSGYGTVYKLDASGTLTLLHAFDGPDGKYPFDNLIRDAKGNFYGTASSGGSAGYGTVWKLTP